MITMESPIKRGGHESDLHMQLKRAAEMNLLKGGCKTVVEANIGHDCKIDVLGLHEEKIPTVIECETLFELQNKLLNTFRKAQIKYGRINPVLCIPKFSDIAEIWCVTNVGKIVKFKKEGES